MHKRFSRAVRHLVDHATGAVFVTAVGLLASCAADQASRYYGSTQYAARPAEEVAVLSEPPERPYEVIADFQSRGESASDMQRKAAAVGADAVIVVHLGGYRSRSDEWASSNSHGDWYSRITGTAIKYKD